MKYIVFDTSDGTYFTHDPHYCNIQAYRWTSILEGATKQTKEDAKEVILEYDPAGYHLRNGVKYQPVPLVLVF